MRGMFSDNDQTRAPDDIEEREAALGITVLIHQGQSPPDRSADR